MKKVLITGKNSYIGNSFVNWMAQYSDEYCIDTVSTMESTWEKIDFSTYDVVFHVAGIAHVDVGSTQKTKNKSNESKQELLYYKINKDLTIEVAKKAKQEGVKQFVFMSSIIVYGDSSVIGKDRVITKDTLPNPSNYYGDSKLQAEKGIVSLQNDTFNVVILRPPMIYGCESKGNYPKLAHMAKKIPVFPKIENIRSMLFVDNLCECIRLLIDEGASGMYFPQNREYVTTSDMVNAIAKVHGKKIHLTRWFNWMLKILAKKVQLINKVFGNLVYDQEMSNYHQHDYCVFDFDQSIERTENRKIDRK